LNDSIPLHGFVEDNKFFEMPPAKNLICRKIGKSKYLILLFSFAIFWKPGQDANQEPRSKFRGILL